MENEIIPPEKYVEKALIDQIFSTTIGSHSESHKEMPRYFKILQKNLMDTITIKQPKQEENKQIKHRNLQIKLTKNYDNWNKMLKYRNGQTFRRGLTKRSYTSKYSNIYRYRKNNREVLSSFGFRNLNKDFTDITSNINYLLERNQFLLMKEKKFMDGFDFHFRNKYSSNIFNRKIYSTRNGSYGKKEEVPLVYESSFTHKNDYFSKSSKSRHEYLLNELNKLKFYLERHPYEKLPIIKDFFLKFNIKDLNKYSDNTLLNIGTIIASSDENELLNLIKPDINVKKMVLNILDIPSINKNNKNYKKLNYTNIWYTHNNFYKKSRNNFFNNKNIISIYNTNSKLKFIENQQKLYLPGKDYSQNIDLIINDIGKEVKDIKDNITNYKEKNGKGNNIFFITQSKNKTISYNDLDKKKLPLSYLNNNKFKSINNRGTFLFFKKSLTKNENNIDNIRDIKKINLCLRPKHNTINEFEIKTKLQKDNMQNKKKVIPRDAIQRLYYRDHLKKLGLNEVKRNKKLTEFIVLNLAKNKSRTKNFEQILKPIKKSYSNNF